MSKFPLGLLVCLTLLSLGLGCGKAGKKNESSSPNDSDFKSPMAGTQVRRGPESIEINGVFTPSRRIKIKSEFDGRLENLSVAKGQAVSRQNPLFTIEDDTLAQELEFLRGQVQVAEALFEENMSMASLEAPLEESQAEELLEVQVEAPVEEVASYRDPTFSRLASEVRFTSVDAGGIWPEVDPRVIERSKDPQDAGGIWPSYGVREMVNGEGPFSNWADYFAAASLPVPESSMEFTRMQNTLLTQPPPPLEILEETETAMTPASTEEESRLSLYQARVDRLRAELAILENELASRIVSSPMDGRIQELAASEGSQVQAGDFLVEIYQVNPIEFSFQVPKDQVDFLELGMTVKGRLADAPDVSFEGEISYIGAELNADKETAEVRARMDNSDDALKVGMKGSAEIELGSGFAARD